MKLLAKPSTKFFNLYKSDAIAKRIKAYETIGKILAVIWKYNLKSTHGRYRLTSLSSNLADNPCCTSLSRLTEWGRTVGECHLQYTSYILHSLVDKRPCTLINQHRKGVTRYSITKLQKEQRKSTWLVGNKVLKVLRNRPFGVSASPGWGGIGYLYEYTTSTEPQYL
jgi:hypothetical protein